MRGVLSRLVDTLVSTLFTCRAPLSGYSQLERITASLGSSMLPEALPFSHVAAADSLSAIVLSGKLQALAECKVFNQRYLYFSYGLPAYRPKGHRVTPAQSPVGFIFATE